MGVATVTILKARKRKGPKCDLRDPDAAYRRAYGRAVADCMSHARGSGSVAEVLSRLDDLLDFAIDWNREENGDGKS